MEPSIPCTGARPPGVSWRLVVRPFLLAVVAAPALVLAACVIDLGGLTGGVPDGGAAGGSAAASSASGSAAGGAAASVLDCAPCPAGGCAATTLASGADADGPAGVAVDSDGLYWVNQGGGTVMRLPASGGPAQVLAQATAPSVIAVTGGYAVWAAQDGVYGCSTASCAGSTVHIAVATVGGSIQGVAYDGTYVYYTDEGSGPDTGVAVRCPPQAGCPGAVTLGNNLDAPLGIALYGDLAFWTEQADGNLNGNLDDSPKGGGGQLRIASALQSPTGVAADGTDVYWTEADPSAGKVRRCPYAGGYCMTPEDLATGLAAPLDLALAGGRVYWSDSGDGKVLSCPVAGCGGGTPRAHATGRTGLRRIALGASCVFWSDDQGGGSVSKAAR
jgi:hypothetical protein